MVCLLQIAVVLSSFLHFCVAAGSTSPIVAQYWPAYSSHLQSPQDIPWNTANIMFYFVTVTTESGFEIPQGQTSDGMSNFVSLAHQNNVKPMFTIGGWTGSKHFSRIAASPALRKSFANRIKAFLDDHHFSGVDLDWEYPGEAGAGDNSPDAVNDTNNFLLLLEEIRHAIGPEALITAAVSMKGFSVNGQVLDDLSPFSKWLDYVMIMAYDVSGPWSPQTGPLAPLHACSSGLGVDTAINVWKSRGIPSSKLLLGLPGYGISFRTKSSQLAARATTVGAQQTQLYNDKENCTPKGDSSDTGGDSSGARTDVCTKTADSGYSGQWKMKNMIKEGILSRDEKRGLKGFERVWDECTQTPFLFNRNARTLISYEDSTSIKLKAEYAMSQDLGGVMIFDTLGFSNDVYKAMKRGLSAHGQAPVAHAQAMTDASLQAQSVLDGLEAPLVSSPDDVHPEISGDSSIALVDATTELAVASKPTATVLATSPKATQFLTTSTFAPAAHLSRATSAMDTTATAASAAGVVNFIRCDTPTMWSLCTSGASCTSMGEVAAGTECRDGQIVCASTQTGLKLKRQGPPMLMRGRYEGSARFAAGHRWRRM